MWAAKLGAVVLPNIGGIAGGLITRSNINPWYENLNKASWRPPNYAFGPIWTILYSGMGYASYLVYTSGGGFKGPAQIPLALYGTQLLLNWSWTPIFFGFHSLKWSLVEICLLDVSVIACTAAFFKVNKLAAYLMVPYIAWLSLATALNYTVYRSNEPEAIEAPKHE